MSRYNESVHSVGSHIVYNCWYVKSHMLADIKRRKSQIPKLKYVIQCVKCRRWNILYVSYTVMWWYNHVHCKVAGVKVIHCKARSSSRENFSSSLSLNTLLALQVPRVPDNTYSPGQRGFKFIVPLHAFMTYSAPRPAVRKLLQVRTVHRGQHWRATNYCEIQLES